MIRNAVFKSNTSSSDVHKKDLEVGNYAPPCYCQQTDSSLHPSQIAMSNFVENLV